MTHTDANAWEQHFTPWISPYADPPVDGVDEAPSAHPISTNADHTGLRTSIDQFPLPRIKVSSNAA